MLSKLNVVFRATLCGTLALAAVSAMGQLQVTTYHNDTLRTGWNPKETILTTANVNPNQFGLLFNLPVDGQVYAQPLYLQNLKITGKGIHNVVFVATEHNSVYAFDADSNTGANAAPLWKVSLGPSCPSGDTSSGQDLYPEVGITSTPVIHTLKNGTQAIYVVAKTKTFDKNNNAVYASSIHVLNVANGAELLKGPFVVSGKVSGTGDASVNGVVTFDPLIQQCRPGLLMVDTPGRDSTLYVGFASHGDGGPYHGWLFAYDAEKMLQCVVFNTTPNALTDPSGYPIAAGGIWQGGGGIASDGTSIYFATGNGTFDPSTKAYGDSILRMLCRTFTVADYFTPMEQATMDDNDSDLGSGGVMLLPKAASGTSKMNLLVQSGKEGNIYLLNTANLGKYHTTDTVVQELPGAISGIWGNPAYANNTIYFGGYYQPITSFPIVNGQINTAGSVQTQNSFAYPGPTPSVSSNGSTNGIVWATWSNYNGGNAILYAYDATVLGAPLYDSSSTNGRDQLDGEVKFTTPTVINGKVYVGTADAVAVFGLGTFTPQPTVTPASGTYTGTVQVAVTESDSKAVVHYTTDGSTPTASSPTYSKPINFTSSVVFKAVAIETGKRSSGVVEQDLLINPVIGTGTGLTGWYYANITNPPPASGTVPTVIQIDPQINFNWGGADPVPNADPNFSGDNFAVQWNGQIQAETTGTYTISTISDDGVQVLINGQMIINDYNYHAPTTDTGTFSFVAGKKYTIQINYMQGGGGSEMMLSWQAPALPLQLVPASQLYPTG